MNTCRFTPPLVAFVPGPPSELNDIAIIRVRMRPLGNGTVQMSLVDADNLLPLAKTQICIISRDEYENRPFSASDEWVEAAWAFAKFRQ